MAEVVVNFESPGEANNASESTPARAPTPSVPLQEPATPSAGDSPTATPGVQIKPRSIVAFKLAPEFEKKGLAEYAANVSNTCDHACTYCFSSNPLDLARACTRAGVEREATQSILDPDAPTVIAEEIRKASSPGLVQLSTLGDAWSPEAHKLRLGEQCLKAILDQPGWEVRILTKNTHVQDDYDLCMKYKDRVRVGLSITGTRDKDDIMKIVEPGASTNSERMDALEKAHRSGLRTYAMFCPLLPGVADSPEQIKELVEFAKKIEATEVFVEPVNNRGDRLQKTVEALRAAGKNTEADAVATLTGAGSNGRWSRYAVRLATNTKQAMLDIFGSTDKLRFLLYTRKLTREDRQAIEALDDQPLEFVRWLEKEQTGTESEDVETDQADRELSVEFELISGNPDAIVRVWRGSEWCELPVPGSLADERIIGAVLEDVQKRWVSLNDSERQGITSKLRAELAKYPIEDRAYRSLPQEARDASDKMLHNPNLLDEIAQDMEKIGIVGERSLALTVYLVGTSRLFDRPLACIVQGHSSSGKSYLISKVAELFPDAVKLQAHSFSPQGLTYCAPGSLTHRFVVAGERSRQSSDQKADENRMWREMLTDGRIARVVSGKLIEQEGPIAYVESTSAEEVFEEDKNRCLVMKTNCTAEQTRKIIDYLGRIAEEGVNQKEIQAIRQKHHAAQLRLRNIEVRLPFGKTLTSRIPADQVENRRSASQILELVKAVALLHQSQRAINTENGTEYILATAEDYRVAKECVDGSTITQDLGLKPGVRETYNAMTWAKDGKEFTILEATQNTLVAGKPRDRATIGGHLGVLEEHGLLRKVSEQRGKHAAKYQLADGDLSGLSAIVLPAPEDLHHAQPTGQTGATHDR